MQPDDIFVLEYATRSYLRKPPVLKPSACTPLFLAAFDRGAGCCIHTHSQAAVLVTLLVERDAKEIGQEASERCFEIEMIEQIKGIPKGKAEQGMLGYHDRLVVPIIENTAHEEDLTSSLEVAMENHPNTYAVLVRRHGVYVWGDDVQKAKTQAERYVSLCSQAYTMLNISAWTISSSWQLKCESLGCHGLMVISLRANTFLVEIR